MVYGLLRKYRYIKVEQHLRDPWTGEYDTYGLSAQRWGPGGWEELYVLNDVAADEAFVAGLAALCTRENLDPGQLKDVVLDHLP